MAVKPEFSRPIAVADIPILAADSGQKGIARTIAAEVGERLALARRFGLLSVGRLTGSIRLYAEKESGTINLEGTFAADIVQACVATLEPVPATIEGTITRRFEPGEPEEREAPADIDPESEDPPEFIIDGTIDIGEIVAEHMGLEIDPYPRAKDAEVESAASENEFETQDGARNGPFEALEIFKRDG